MSIGSGVTRPHASTFYDIFKEAFQDSNPDISRIDFVSYARRQAVKP